RGPRRVLATGWCGYAVLWTAVGLSPSLFFLAMAAAIYGAASGLTEGAERALVADLSEGTGRGRSFGVYNMLLGVAALVSSPAFGAVWDRFGVVAFPVWSALAVMAAFGLPSFAPPPDRSPASAAPPPGRARRPGRA